MRSTKAGRGTPELRLGGPDLYGSSLKDTSLWRGSTGPSSAMPSVFELMFYTYGLRSIEHPGRYYTGHTSDLKMRLAEHNRGKCAHTSKFAPWKIHCYFAFHTESLARNFEQYLKSGSGRAFAKKHFEDESDNLHLGEGPIGT